MCLEKRIFPKSISFECKIVALTRKWFYVFILPLNHFWKRERERERERERVESLCSWPIAPQGKPSSLRSSKALIAEIVCQNRPPRSPRSSAEIAEKLMASSLPPKFWSLPSLSTKLMAPITLIWREWIVGLWPVSWWWWGSVVWVLGLWAVAGCVGFYWVVVGLLIAIVDVDGLLRWICVNVGFYFLIRVVMVASGGLLMWVDCWGGFVVVVFCFFVFNQSYGGGRWWFVDVSGLLRWVCGGNGGFFWYKICLEDEKIVEKMCRKIAFSECYQTHENIF